ncbi:LIM zinc-binding domain-containing Nebulette-like [Eleginops maclovinus]|uniref:LIM zinc-binding domain-containing Nebulette-like n=1 Tax=Eleginops maclovinus TaxID=56733 RepID=UPI0030801810
MNPQCARCGKIVYPTEKVSCLDKNWHKGCFSCEVCKMTLNMKNYKGYDKKPYCNAHYPKTSFTIVADTPENLRLRQQSELQSQVKYKKDFEESKGRGFSIVSDTPEMQRLRRTQEQISIVCTHTQTHVYTMSLLVLVCVYECEGCTLVSEHNHTHTEYRQLLKMNEEELLLEPMNRVSKCYLYF